MQGIKICELQTKYLAGAGVVLGDTSVTVSDLTDIYGNPVTMADYFGGIGYCTLEQGTPNERCAAFTAITQNAGNTATLTGLVTVAFNGFYPFTTSSGLDSDHSGGTSIDFSNSPALMSTFCNIFNDTRIQDGVQYIFPGTTANKRPQLVVDVDAMINTELVTYGQLARTAIAGGVNASTVIQGFVQMATQAQYDAKTRLGSTGAFLVADPSLNRATKYNDYVPDTGAVNAYVITPSPAISSYAAGDQFTFLVSNTNTGPSTINVSGLGLKAIVKNVSQPLTGGELEANAIVSVIYNGSVFQISSTGTAIGGGYQEVTFTTSGTWICPRGVTQVLVDIVGGGGGASNGTNGSGTAGGGGGGGGGGLFNQPVSVIPFNSYSVTIGAAGTQGTSGGNGGSTNFASVTVPGGHGAAALVTVGVGAIGGAAGDSTAGAGGNGGNTSSAGANGTVGTAGGTPALGGAASGVNAGGGGGGASGLALNGGNGGNGSGSSAVNPLYGGGGGGYPSNGSGTPAFPGIVVIKIPISQIA